jgi:hypothetical protein
MAQEEKTTTTTTTTATSLIDTAPMLESRVEEKLQRTGRSLEKGDSSETDTIVDENGKGKEHKLEETHVIPKNNLVSFPAFS